MNRHNLVVYASGKGPINNTPFEVVERKGIGHPDTLCDTIAERVSQAYSLYCLKRYGVILRHMVDKIAMSGGSSRVRFGGGEMIKPVRLYLNCRFTRTFQGEEIPYLEIASSVIREHFAQVMPLLDLDTGLSIVDNTHFSQGPGVVYSADDTSANERRHFFDVPDKSFAGFHDNGLRANDTSTSVAYYPLSVAEQVALLVEQTLNGASFKTVHSYVGTDIKVMVKRIGLNIEVTVCVPFIAQFTPDYAFYASQLDGLRMYVQDLVTTAFSDYTVTAFLNTRDNPEKSDHYLTLTGSAIESGDEGVVGRGNRYNGVIPFTRHMTMEACCGKNPVYHVGKVYTALCSVIAKRIFDETGTECYVYMTSQMGRPMNDPWGVCVEVSNGAMLPSLQSHIENIVEHCLQDIPNITKDIVNGSLVLY